MRHDIEKLKAKIGERVVVASVSGGKDSTAMALYLKEIGIPYRAVHLETGWEHAATNEYIKNVLPKFIGPIETIKGKIKIKDEAKPYIERIEKIIGAESQMVRLVLQKGMFPSRITRFCTQELKIYPMKEFLTALDVDAINCTGIRASESRARSKYPEWEWWDDADCEQWRPILKWTDDQVVEIHKRHNVPPNPLYLRGATRVGCWPCIYARKGEIRNLVETDPGRIEIIEELESAMNEMAATRYAKKGETFESLGYALRSWFQARSTAGNSSWPIAKVVEWSMTKRGGRQFEMFAPPAREWGCMRWGVCDTGIEGE